MKTHRWKIACLFMGSVILLLFACSTYRPNSTSSLGAVSQTPIPISTLNTQTSLSSITTRLQAVIAARNYLGSSRLNFSTPPAVVFAGEIELASAFQYTGWTASGTYKEQGKTIVWLVVFEGEGQIIPPDPIHTITPPPPTHGCAAVIVIASDGMPVAMGSIDCPVSSPTLTASPGVSGQGESPTAVPAPGLVVFGKVTDQNGVGVENVNIYRSYAAYSGVVIAATDANGEYASIFYPIPGDENVSIWAELPGSAFDPEYCRWRHYFGFEKRECNFQVKAP